MIKTLKFTDCAESKLFITGCLHLNHNPNWEVPLWKLRGYNSAQECTDDIIKTINNTLRESDVLLVLGDFCLNTSPEQFLELMDKICCKVYMISGNHNSPWEKMYFDHCIEKFGYEVINYTWLDKITYLGDYAEIIWNKKLFCCSHFPLLVFNKSMHASIMLHSHTHSGLKSSLPEATDSGKILDCGWDTFKRPVGFDEIIEICDKKPIKKFDAHH